MGGIIKLSSDLRACGAILVSFILILLFSSRAVSMEGDFVWARGIGGSGTDIGWDISVDSSDNTFTVGEFADMVNFHRGESIYRKVSKGETDIFISKRNSSGHFVWTRVVGGSGSDRAYSVAVDNGGNVYVTGYFSGTVDFDPGYNQFNLSSNGPLDIFISKYDGEGDLVWAIKQGGGGQDWGKSIFIDNTGNVYVAGAYSDKAYFGNQNESPVFLTSAGNRDIFVAKYDTNGSLIWVKTMGSFGDEAADSVVVDEEGNVYTLGSFGYEIDFDPGPGSFLLDSTGTVDVFISKLDSNGDFVWAKSIGGDERVWGEGIIIDSAGDIFLTGYFESIADFDPSTDIFSLTSNGLYDIFLSKLDNNGNFIWAKGIGGTGVDKARDIVVEPFGNIYITGIFNSTVDFDPGSGVTNLTAPVYGEAYFASYTSDGIFRFAKVMGGNHIDTGYGLEANVHGDIYVTGMYASYMADFDPSGSIYNLTNYSDFGESDFFIAKYEGLKRYLPRFYNLMMPAIFPHIQPVDR